jgi:hypothetical protein
LELAAAKFDQGVVAALVGAAPVRFAGGGVRDGRGQAVQGGGDDRPAEGVEVAADVPAGTVLVRADRQAAFAVRGLLSFQVFALIPCLGAFGVDAFSQPPPDQGQGGRVEDRAVPDHQRLRRRDNAPVEVGG